MSRVRWNVTMSPAGFGAIPGGNMNRLFGGESADDPELVQNVPDHIGVPLIGQLLRAQHRAADSCAATSPRQSTQRRRPTGQVFPDSEVQQ